jgi:hypothetical protein
VTGRPFSPQPNRRKARWWENLIALAAFVALVVAASYLIETVT